MGNICELFCFGKEYTNTNKNMKKTINKNLKKGNKKILKNKNINQNIVIKNI